jgi:type VI secretion system secreted protein VgrG
MAKEVYTITCSALPDSTRVTSFRGAEGISRTYEFHVYLLVGADGKDLELDDVVGAKATLSIDRGDDRPPFLFNGILCSFELLNELADGSLFHAVLVPQLWQLTQTYHSRIWTKKGIDDIIKEVLQDGGLASSDFDLQLAQTYKPEEHVCQYHESDFDFISRWMEREGMYYYFEQGSDGEKLVITDSKDKHDVLDTTPVRFAVVGGHDVDWAGALYTFTCASRALPASVKLKDYDYTKPTLDVSGEAAVSKVGFGEICVYGHRFFTPDDGKRLAQIRAQELLARKAVYRGVGTRFYLRPGYFFKLEEHPRAAFDQKYLAVEVEHVGNQHASSPEMRRLTGIDSDKGYEVEVKAIPADTQFRAVRSTEWPRIYGFENGTVCGPADSDYAQIDDHGRYNVKFKFDESDLKNGQASTFVRKMEPHGGNPEGFHFPLRKGTEVVFSFLGGDPDRPVIAGVVNDTRNPSPVTGSNHTTNILHTGGDNHFELEDQAGQQRVTLSTPHATTHILMGNPTDGYEFTANTQGNSLHNTDGNHDTKIGGDGTRKTTGEQEDDTGEGHKIKVGKNWTITVGVDKHETVQGNTIDDFIGNKTENTFGTTKELMVGSETSMKAATSVETTVGNKSETNISDSTETTIGNKTEMTIGNSTGLTIGSTTETHIGNKTETHVGNSTETTNGNSTEHVTGLTLETFVGAKAEMSLSAVFSLTVGLALEIFGGGALEISAFKHEISPESGEMKAIHSELKGARTAIAGLRQATIGVANAACGANSNEAALNDVAAGLQASNAGLTAMN